MADNKDYITYSENKGSINISEEVIASIAANAALETEGVAGLSGTITKDIAELLGKKSTSKGVKITIEDNSLKVYVFVIAKLGFAVNKVGEDVQKAVISEIESATGFSVDEVNVRICGVSLERDK